MVWSVFVPLILLLGFVVSVGAILCVGADGVPRPFDSSRKPAGMPPAGFRRKDGQA